MKVYENIKYGPAEEQALDVYIPDAEEFPVFVYLHGGGFENGSKKMDFIPALCEKGVAVVSGEYRKYPNGAKYPEFLEDAASVVAWAKKNVGGSQYGKVSHFYVGGSSAGGYATMMLCFNPAYLAAHGLSNADINAYYHDAGQPTAHFNVLKERGIDERRIIVDESAPLYYVDETPYPPMELVVSEHDISNRYEQIQLLMGTLRHFGHDMSKVFYTYKEGWHHCKYMYEPGDHGNWIFADMIYEFVERMEGIL